VTKRLFKKVLHFNTKMNIKKRLKKKGTIDIVVAESVCVNADKGAALTFMPYLKQDLNGI